MKRTLSIILASLISTYVMAEAAEFDKDPDVYRGAYYGHLIKGSIVVDGVRLSPGETTVQSVSYVHSLKNEHWYRSAKVSSRVHCKISSRENPSFYVAEIDTHLSLDGQEVIKVLPLLAPLGDPDAPKKECGEEGSRQSGEQIPNHSAQLAPSGLGRSASLRAPGAGRYTSCSG